MLLYINIQTAILGSAWAVSNYIGVVVFGFLFIVALIITLTDKKSTYDSRKKINAENEKLTFEARDLLYKREIISGKNKYKYLHYAKKKEWVDWFIQGYQDGTKKYVISSHCTNKEYTWEEAAESHINGVREELVGGSRSISLNAYKDGYREGLKKREKKQNMKL